MSRANRPPPKDMYWFAHGGTETDSPSSQRNTAQCEDDDISGSPSWNISSDRKGSPDEPRGLLVTDGSTSSGPSSLERDDRLRTFDKRLAVEERRKQLWEAEQERNDAVLRKHMEREAALEARRNAQRSNISFAFGSSIPRNVEVLHANDGRDSDIMSRSFTASGLTQREENHYTFHDRRSVSPLNCNGYLVGGECHQSDSSQSCITYSERKVLPPPNWLTGSGALVGDDVMSKSMNASLTSAPRGRRKNDLMPTVPYERTPPARASTSSSTRKRSVSMTRLDQLALPRRHYVEANKANSSASSGASSMLKDNIRSPTRPLSSASENSGGSGRVPGTVKRRLRSAPRKPRPVSIAGSLPDHKQVTNVKPLEVKVSPNKHYTASKRTAELSEPRKSAQTVPKSSTPKSAEKTKTSSHYTPTPKSSTPKTGAPKPTTPKPAKLVESKTSAPKPTSKKTESSKVKDKNSQLIKKKTDVVTATPSVTEIKEKSEVEKQNESIASQDSDVAAENEKNNAKRIISEEEAKAALAEKRRLAREQAEREAELERQRQEELRRQEEERIRLEEEEHRRMEEEQLRLLEEHRLQEEEKLRKAIEEQEQKEKEEKAKRDEELQMKAELERKAKEEAEKQRLELEEKLRKEEEERAERKKRLEKIMSRTRGKSSGTSPSGSVSGSEQLDSGEHAQEGFSSGANSLDSNEAGELPSEPVSIEDHAIKAEVSSVGDSMEAHPTYEICSENESLNSNDLIMPTSETASQDNSLVIIPDKTDLVAESDEMISTISPVTRAAGEELATAAEFHVSESSVSLSKVENEFSAVSENEESKLSQADKVENSSEISDPAKEVASDFISENPNDAVESCLDDQMKDSIHEDMLPSEQQIAQNQDLVTKLEDTVVSDDVEKIQVHYESQLDTKINSQEDNKDSEDVTKHPSKNDFGVVSNVNDVLHSQNEEFLLPEPSSMPSNLSFGIDGVDCKEPDLLEPNQDSSVSSDIKLPDPIYETSDEGSVSSDKHQQFDHHEDFNYNANQDNTVLEEVFAEQAVISNIDSANQHSPTFLPDAYAENHNPFSTDSSEYVVQSSMPSDNPFQTQFEGGQDYCMSESMYQDKTLDSVEQPRDIEEENVTPSRSSTSSVIEADVHLHESELSKQSDVFYQNTQDNKENLITEIVSSNSAEMTSQFVQDDMTASIYDIYSNKENLVSAPTTQQNLEVEDNRNVEPTKDNPFEGNMFSERSELHTFQPQGNSFNIDQQQLCAAPEQIDNFENQTVQGNEFSSQNEQVNDVTFIKSEDNGAYVGIISSLDHDHSTNDFPKPSLYERLQNNLECASMTDSEENSSLDSNLSQVMTVENSEKDTLGGLNHMDKPIIESNSSKSTFSNGEQHNPFETDPFKNYDINSKSNVNYYSASEMSNGHSVESSKQMSDELGELHNYGQLDGGNDILSVDHSKNNIFENVDAIDYDKVSPDPFLAKGNAKQISGNPFLLQDDQKQVLMTPDFLN